MNLPIKLKFRNGTEFELLIREETDTGTVVYNASSEQLDEIFDSLYERQFVLVQQELDKENQLIMKGMTIEYITDPRPEDLEVL